MQWVCPARRNPVWKEKQTSADKEWEALLPSQTGMRHPLPVRAPQQEEQHRSHLQGPRPSPRTAPGSLCPQKHSGCLSRHTHSWALPPSSATQARPCEHPGTWGLGVSKFPGPLQGRCRSAGTTGTSARAFPTAEASSTHPFRQDASG